MGSIKPVLFELSNQLPGSRVLDGRPGIDPHAMAMPKGRDLGVAYARQFIEDAKSEGLVKAAIERAGLRGVVVAPLRRSVQSQVKNPVFPLDESLSSSVVNLSFLYYHPA